MADSAQARGFAPVARSDARLLILGSMPGQASLAAVQYYAHPRNQFWPLLSTILNDDLFALPYAERLQKLLQHRIGLWDVITTCERRGSLDSAIRQAQEADFSQFHDRYPQLHTIAFNGKTAGKAAPRFDAAGYRTLVLPSTSPANAQLSFSEKLQYWQRLAATEND